MIIKKSQKAWKRAGLEGRFEQRNYVRGFGEQSDFNCDCSKCWFCGSTVVSMVRIITFQQQALDALGSKGKHHEVAEVPVSSFKPFCHTCGAPRYKDKERRWYGTNHSSACEKMEKDMFLSLSPELWWSHKNII